ncbi:MAG: 4'-phosphopantetheinyl transferase superfamily protein [Deltaproteobacteria bacterium]|nr:4'-phosphopantetheinyl transferase superfamily protein [Deltaproteobacteria bacterium]
MPLLGNDIVDLEMAENRGKCTDSRFLGRVFTAPERALIARAAAPDALLWALWAVKEAAYKAVSRADPAVDSIPRRYPVLFAGEEGGLGPDGPEGFPGPSPAGESPVGGFLARSGRGSLAGRVLTPRGVLALQVTLTDRYVHALTATTPADLDRSRWQVEEIKNGDIAADPSVLVRAFLCREMAVLAGCPAAELQVRKSPLGSGAPDLCRRGVPLPFTISLSHDGRFVAYAWQPAA